MISRTLFFVEIVRSAFIAATSDDRKIALGGAQTYIENHPEALLVKKQTIV